MSTHLPKLHRINIAAAALGVSRATIYRFVNQGKLTPVQLGKNSSAITEDSLRALMAVDPATINSDGETGAAFDAATSPARRVDPFAMSNARNILKQRRGFDTNENPEIDHLGYALSKHVVDMARCALTWTTLTASRRWFAPSGKSNSSERGEAMTEAQYHSLHTRAWTIHSILIAMIEALPDDPADSPIATRFLLRHVASLSEPLANELMELTGEVRHD